ncbi:hypothetical protein D3C85_1043460 [compost metagenome]
MMVGDLPPSSNVSGVRFCAAAAITRRPTLGLPVKMMWSSGKALNAAPTSAPPAKAATSVSSKWRASRSISRVAVAGVNSDSVIIARLPAAKASAKGASEMASGKFHGVMMPMLPNG